MKFGIIGCGKMGSAILKGVLNANVFNKEDVVLFDTFEPTKIKLLNDGFYVANSISEVFSSSDIVLLSVKPQELNNVLSQVETNKKVGIISIMAGISIATLAQKFNSCPIARVMPNTCATIGKAASSVCFSENCTKEYKEIFLNVICSFGSASVIDETLMDEVVPLAGSFTAYAYYYAKCFIESAEKRGVPTDVATKLLVDTMIGSAEMIKTSGKDIDTLISDVCSKGGTTIAGLDVLKEKGLDKIVDECSIKCANRSKELGKK